MIHRITNPAALDIPEIEGLLTRAFEQHPWLRFPQVKYELAMNIQHWSWGLFIGFEQMTPKAMLLVSLPTSVFGHVSVVMIYNEGSKKLAGQLIDRGVEWTRNSGYNEVVVMNGSRAPDEIWLRAFRRAGTMHRLGSVYRLELAQ